MIGKNVTLYCCEDISLIENYEAAISDETQTWHCHHRKETDLGLSIDELIEQDKYFNVLASELIFLTPSEHHKLHNHGEKNPMYGKNFEDYMSEEAIKERSKKLSEKFKGENNPMYGKNPEDYMSEEAIKEKRQKQSIAGKKRFEDPKERQKISEKNSGENNPMFGKAPWNKGLTKEEMKNYKKK